MSIGEALATARDRAGLTVTQVSAGTRIRESIVAGIERDDYASCGGDFYARGHIRAIAGVVGIDPRPLIEEFDADRRAEQAAEADRQAQEPALIPMRLREPRMARGRRGVNWTAVLAVLVVVAVGFAGYLLVSGGSGSGQGDVDAASSAHRGAGHSAKPSPSASTTAPAVTRARVLRPVSAVAFGPGGEGTGDDAEDAGLAIDGDPSTAWHTDWYATAEFGALQDGTGLLLDFGKPVSVTAARLTLASVSGASGAGGASGASVQLRAGDAPALADLKPVAETGHTGQPGQPGEVVTMTVSSAVRARYLLVWFTKLPQDAAGTFMASIYAIRLDGLAGKQSPGPG